MISQLITVRYKAKVGKHYNTVECRNLAEAHNLMGQVNRSHDLVAIGVTGTRMYFAGSGKFYKHTLGLLAEAVK